MEIIICDRSENQICYSTSIDLSIKIRAESKILKMWHQRLGQVNLKTIHQMVTKGEITVIKLTNKNNFVCKRFIQC